MHQTVQRKKDYAQNKLKQSDKQFHNDRNKAMTNANPFTSKW
jgi:hypothetical protein